MKLYWRSRFHEKRLSPTAPTKTRQIMRIKFLNKNSKWTSIHNISWQRIPIVDNSICLYQRSVDAATHLVRMADLAPMALMVSLVLVRLDTLDCCAKQVGVSVTRNSSVNYYSVLTRKLSNGEDITWFTWIHPSSQRCHGWPSTGEKSWRL